MLPVLTAALAGRYTILRELRRGGMGAVYLATDLKHARDVALKVLTSGRFGLTSGFPRGLAAGRKPAARESIA